MYLELDLLRKEASLSKRIRIRGTRELTFLNYFVHNCTPRRVTQAESNGVTTRKSGPALLTEADSTVTLTFAL